MFETLNSIKVVEMVTLTNYMSYTGFKSDKTEKM